MSFDKFISDGVVDSQILQQKQDSAWRQHINNAVDTLDRTLDQAHVPIREPAYGNHLLGQLTRRGLVGKEALEHALDEINAREARVGKS